MRIGLVAVMITALLVASTLSWATISYPGVVVNKLLLPVLALKPNKAFANTFAELKWLQSLFGALGLALSKPPTLRCDNIGATYLSSNPVFHARTKHMEIDFHFVRDMVASKTLIVQFISSKDQLADLLTKPISSSRFAQLRTKLNVLSIPLGLRGNVKDKDKLPLLLSHSRLSKAHSSIIKDIDKDTQLEICT